MVSDPRMTRGYAYLHVGEIDPATEDFRWVEDCFPAIAHVRAATVTPLRRRARCTKIPATGDELQSAAGYSLFRS